MTCMICGSRSNYYFSKSHIDGVYRKFISGIGPVEYFKCEKCGFVYSATHQNLSRDAWKKLNIDFHSYVNNLKYDEKPSNSPPYAEQALMLALAGEGRIIDISSMLDYAGGHGTLSRLMLDLFNINLPIYDPYIWSENAFYVKEKDLRTYKVVFNSAMFEHVLHREDLDRVYRLVSTDGVMIIHTVVCETIPKDQNWFYLTPPVHTAFHTNKSMNILMEQWGFKSSIYAPKAKSWILTKEKYVDVFKKIEDINHRLKTSWFLSKEGFVDYWK